MACSTALDNKACRDLISWKLAQPGEEEKGVCDMETGDEKADLGMDGRLDKREGSAVYKSQGEAVTETGGCPRPDQGSRR